MEDAEEAPWCSSVPLQERPSAAVDQLRAAGEEGGACEAPGLPAIPGGGTGSRRWPIVKAVAVMDKS